jgi:aminotransferase EvaB
MNKNFLIKQYNKDDGFKIKHNYLEKQFRNSEKIFSDIKKLVKKGDYTLGTYVSEFENNIKKMTKAKYCLGVGSGTDAIFLSLKAIDLKNNDEVITTSYTFYATVGAIVTAGGKPIFVDINNSLNIDPDEIEKKITKKTKAIVIVHWSGYSCDMDKIMKISRKYKIPVIEDACHGIKASYKTQPLGTFGLTGCFSLHPLKNLNVWGDGGFLITNSKKMYTRLSLLRNHGLVSRDKCKIYGYNSRLDSIQAIVANNLLKKLNHITSKRQSNANLYDLHLSKINQITVPNYNKKIIKHVYHLYMVIVKNRSSLIKFLHKNGIDAKIHYPTPMHLQPASKVYGYKKGDFPITEKISKNIMSLPVHEFLNKTDLLFVIKKIKDFYEN